MASKITTLNWNTTHYYSDNLIAFISLGASPSENDSDIVIQYHVTLSNKDYEDIYQSTHADLEAAILALNQKYGDWPIKGLEQNSSESGCSSCAAH